MKLTIIKSRRLAAIAATLAFFITPVFSQATSPQAGKFDEFSPLFSYRYSNYFSRNYEEERKDFEMRIARYLRRLQLEKARAYIIGYGERVNSYRWNDYSVGKSRAEKVKDALITLNFDVKNIEILDGGIREKEATELWIVPPGAAVPKPSPEFKKEDVIKCPQVYVTAEQYVPISSKTLEFSADVKANGPVSAMEYDWQVENAKIVSGQGSKTIQVEPTIKSGTVTAQINLKGFPLDCSQNELTAGRQTVLGIPHYKLDDFGLITNGDIKARLDQLAIALQNDESLQGYIVIYQGRSDPKAQVKRREVLMQTYLFRNRGIDPKRVSFVDGGFRETLSSELWLAVTGSGLPPLTPTVDRKYAAAKP